MQKKIEQEFLAAYEQYAEAIYRYCYFRLWDKGRAEELMQDTFTKAWAYIAKGKKVDNLRAFLYRVAGNLIIDESRKNKVFSLEEWLEKGEENDIPTEGHKDILKSIMVKEIKTAMSRLRKDDQQVLTLRFVNDLDPKEIAEILKITPNNASVRINRALAELKKEIE